MHAPATSPNGLVVLGPTASGKTRLGVALAREFGGEVVSADSRQVYRGLDIGAGKDLAEYAEGGPPVPCHLIDVAGLGEEYSVFHYQRDFYRVFEDLLGRGALPVVVGGTGLYLEAALMGYRMVEAPPDPALRAELAGLGQAALTERLRALKPELHNTTDLTDRERTVRAIEIAEHARRHPPAPAPEVRALILGVRWPREALRARIRARLRQRLDAGLVEEVRGLLDAGVPRAKLQFLGLEYRYVDDFLHGRIANRNDLEQQLASAIGRFTKRQVTWFRRMEKRGAAIHWVDRAGLDQARALAAAGLQRKETLL